MQTYTIMAGIQLVTEECYKCHIVFALPRSMQERCFRVGDSFYCPNGHPQVYRQTETDNLRHKLDQREAELEQTSERLRGALKEITNKKRVITRIKNRVYAGVCIECQRHFENLERHMKTKHNNKEELWKSQNG